MSLVYEALRKAEREKERRSGVAPVRAAVVPSPEPPRTAVTTPTATPRETRWPLMTITLIAGCTLIAVGAVVWMTRTTVPVATIGGSRSGATVPQDSARPEPRPPEKPAPPPATPTANDPRFKLTGITGNPQDGFQAIIN